MTSDITVVSFVAYSGTGKTTLIEKLIPLLCARGMRVAVVKHDAHSFSIDKPGKDSYRFSAAGASVTAIVSGARAAIMENRPVDFDDVLSRIGNVDIIITEGYNTGPYPKLALRRAGGEFPAAVERCIALVSDDEADKNREKNAVPWFHIDAAAEIAEFLAERVRKIERG
ncbi:MAG: molybdopterin-guanine dinucleotide biosynthesis protein B [Oscillospiraceae bacterium]|jgi:molybdopterin-guanine dinucleotide biosynthesis protein MobB|nr:molybdopterin-guanine dinucleotide biosynthesis protein B [Oscillospiraceae bacterium]